MCIMRVYISESRERIAMRDHVYSIVLGNSRYPAGELGGSWIETREAGEGRGGHRRSIAGHTNRCRNTRASMTPLLSSSPRDQPSLARSFTSSSRARLSPVRQLSSLSRTKLVRDELSLTMRSTKYLRIIIGITAKITRSQTETSHLRRFILRSIVLAKSFVPENCVLKQNCIFFCLYMCQVKVSRNWKFYIYLTGKMFLAHTAFFKNWFYIFLFSTFFRGRVIWLVGSFVPRENNNLTIISAICSLPTVKLVHLFSALAI